MLRPSFRKTPAPHWTPPVPDVLVPPRDAQPDGPVEASVDSGVDAGPECDVTKEFDTPQLIPSLSTPGHEGDPRFFADDELTVTFDAVRGDAGTTDIYQATRSSLGAAFGTPVKLDTINTDEYEHSGNLTQDGLSAFFERQERATRISRIMRATRPSKAAPWGVASPVDLNAGTYTAFPFVRGDGNEIYLIAKTEQTQKRSTWASSKRAQATWSRWFPGSTKNLRLPNSRP